MLIQNKETQWFMDSTLPSVFVQGLDTLPSFLCYELLMEPTGAKILISKNVSLCQDGQHAPGFLKLLLCGHLCVCMCVFVCVFDPEGINNQRSDVTPYDWLNKFYGFM